MWSRVTADGNPMSSHDRQRRASTDAPAARIRRPVQARLEVGPVDDPMEVEAEATADRVIAAIQTSGGPQAIAARKLDVEEEAKSGSPASADSKKLPAGLAGGAPTNEMGEAKTGAGGGPSPAELKNTGGAPAGLDEEEAKRSPIDAISRMGGPEEELPTQGFRIARVEEEELLQGSRTARASAIGAEGGAVDADLESRLTAGGGAPLPEPVRATMEGAFGADFSAVRVSENPAAAEIGALAYTTGADVRFAPGRFQPGSADGQHLLAHELTHVVQQGAAPAATTARATEPVRRDAVDLQKLTFEDVMAGHRKPYREFLTADYSVENLDFIEAVESGWDPQKIVDTFLSNNAPQQINVTDAERMPVIVGEAHPSTVVPSVKALLKSNFPRFQSDPASRAKFAR